MESREDRVAIICGLGPWDEQTIAMLLGHASDDLRVELLGKDPNALNNTYTAKLTFRTEAQMQRITQNYDGMVIPMTHGYHYYKFHSSVATKIETTESPPLHLQLMALTTRELERRVKSICIEDAVEPVKFSNNKQDKVHSHASLAYRLAKVMQFTRPIRFYRGVPVPKGATSELLNYLRACDLWPAKEMQRKGVVACNYLTVRVQHGQEYNQIWDLCRDLIHNVIPDAIYNALAITKGFRGSPHVDVHDKTFQHVIALGDFVGGQLCCEADDEGMETVAIDVNCRFGRIDGRAVHWVNSWCGERYSVVYYSTDEKDETEQVSQIEHTAWMEGHPSQDIKTKKVPMKNYEMHLNSNETYSNHRLPSSLPIVGLGCSSFSAFFSSGDDVLTVDTITNGHPTVQGWIKTIR